ncbi:MAG: 8-oxoguanine glycosylase domain protein [Verrucomicrobia bacterium]|nr:8-oxoguanine glycosylase domain protein [Verrucomicrobiota bacterium]
MNAMRFPVKDYDLAATLASGQAFRWRLLDGVWEGVVGKRWVRLSFERNSIGVSTAIPAESWSWLEDYLQTAVDLSAVIASFPDDVPMCESVAACHGLRLLKQEPWECLASFILSSTKQIVQIQQIVELLCVRYGERVLMPEGRGPVYAFPTAERLAQCTEAELRESKMGFRARYLLAAAQAVASGRLDLESLRKMSCAEARECSSSIFPNDVPRLSGWQNLRLHILGPTAGMRSSTFSTTCARNLGEKERRRNETGAGSIIHSRGVQCIACS